MATEANMLRDGNEVSGFDARNSAITGTTLKGPNGSGQFLAVRLSTSVDRTIVQCTVSGVIPYGILQNKPSTGIAADVCFLGVSKCVSGSSAIAPGMELEVNSDGSLIPYSSGAGVWKAGRSIEAATSVGAVFSAMIYGGIGSGQVA